MIKAIQIRYDRNFELSCKSASKAGFLHMAINFSHGLSMDWSDKGKIYADAKAVLEKYSLECVQAHLPCYGLTESSEVVREDMEDCIHKALEVSGRLGAKWCAYHTRDSVSTGFLKKQAISDNYELVSKFLETAVKFDTGIAIENLPLFAPFQFLTSSTGELCQLVDKFNTSSVGVCWDTGHANLLPYEQDTALRYIGKRLVCTHLHDNNKDDDWHHPVTFGNIDWKVFSQALSDISYNGPLTLECSEAFLDGKVYPESLADGYMKFCYNSLRYVDELSGGGVQ